MTFSDRKHLIGPIHYWYSIITKISATTNTVTSIAVPGRLKPALVSLKLLKSSLNHDFKFAIEKMMNQFVFKNSVSILFRPISSL